MPAFFMCWKKIIMVRHLTSTEFAVSMVYDESCYAGGTEMTVYAEYLFLENFTAGLILLYLTARLGGTDAGILRLTAGAVLSGMSGFLLFLPLNCLEAVLLRAAAAAVICAAALGADRLLKKTALFFILSFLTGGAAMAFFLWQQIPVLAGNGVLYLDSMTYPILIFCGAPAMALAAWFVKLVRRKRRTDWTCGTAELEMDGRSTHLSACVDSGNSLTEPISGRPVILIDKAGAKKLPFRREDYPQRYAAVPYRAVGVKQGILEGLRINRISYAGKDYHNVILAYFEGTFEEFEVLLNRNILEGGVAEDDSYTCGRPEKPGGAILQETAGAAAEKRAGWFIQHRRK